MGKDAVKGGSAGGDVGSDRLERVTRCGDGDGVFFAESFVGGSSMELSRPRP